MDRRIVKALCKNEKTLEEKEIAFSFHERDSEVIDPQELTMMFRFAALEKGWKPIGQMTFGYL